MGTDIHAGVCFHSTEFESGPHWGEVLSFPLPVSHTEPGLMMALAE